MKRLEAYVATCLHTGLRYIGVTRNGILFRWHQHFVAARNGAPGRLMGAIREYGESGFKVEHVASAKSWRDLLVLETLLIQQYGTLWPLGYNLTSGGNGCAGSDETRARMSIAAAQRAKHWSPLHRARISEAKRGKPRSEETIEKIRAAALRRAAEGFFIAVSPEARARGAIKRNATMAAKRAAGWVNPAIGQVRRKRTLEERAAHSAALRLWWKRRMEADVAACMGG